MRLHLLLLFAVFLAGCQKHVSNTLRVGMELTYPPFESQDSSGNPEGVSVKIAEALAKDLGRPLKIVPMEFSGLIPALKSGSIDMVISSMTATDARRESIDFSEPYAFTGLALLVSKGSDIQSVRDLDSPQRSISVKSATTGESWSTENLPETKRTAFSEDAACVLEVAQGRADAFIYDQLSILRYHKKNPDTTRAILEPFTEEAWAIGIAKNNSELLSKTNAFIAKFRADGGFEKLAAEFLTDEKAEMESRNLQFLLR